MTVKETEEILDFVSFRNTGNFHAKCQFLPQNSLFMHRLVGNMMQMPLQSPANEEGATEFTIA